MQANSVYEISGSEALKLRHLLEEYITSRAACRLQPTVSAALTWATGIAPAKYAGQPVFQPSLTRETGYLVTAFAAAAALMFLSGPFPLLGAVVLLGACRSLVSGTGHVLNHKSKSRAVRFVYDALSGVLALASWEQYKTSHRHHHEDTTSFDDPDRQMLEYLSIRPVGLWSFLHCTLRPRVHRRFYAARLHALFIDGPRWRAMLFCFFASMLLMASAPKTLFFYGTVVVGYQTVAIAAWLSLHRWWVETPKKPTAKELALAVTLGRLNLPSASFPGVISLIGNVMVSSLIHPGAGERNHDLHHGAWKNTLGTHCPYTRTTLILAGIELRQTGSLRSMYAGAFSSAKAMQVIERSSNIDDDVFLSL